MAKSKPTAPLVVSPTMPFTSPLGSPQRSASRRRYVYVTPRVFRCAWLSAALLHVVCAVYYGGIAYSYWVTTRDSSLAIMLQFYRLGIAVAGYRHVAVTYGAMSIIHVALLTFMVGCSVRSRRWSFSAARQATTQITRETKEPQTKPVEPTPETRRRGCWKSLEGVFGRHGLLGVEGPYFDAHHLALEVIQTALQSYQAYRMSQHVPRPWFNNLFVGLIVVNCVCTPLLQYVFIHHSLVRRVLCLAIDALLDLISSVVVPATLLLLYSADYATSSDIFQTNLWFNDTWFVTASNEFQLLLVTSYGDLAARVVISLGFIASLESIKDLVRGRAPASVAVASSVGDTVPQAPRGPAIHRAVYVIASQRSWLQWTMRGRQVKGIAHSGLAAWGVLILVLHLHAASLPQAPVCAMQVRPWLLPKPSCALMLIDCSRANHANLTTSEIDAQYRTSDPTRVVRLIIRHCPALHMPPAVQTLCAITAIKMYNSSIVHWPSDAALTSTHHPVLKTVSLIRVWFPNGELPDGLTNVDFPKHVTSFLVCTSNLKTLSPDLATRWPQYAYFLFEDSRFETFPSVLTALRPLQISFAHNQFAAFPFEALAIPSLIILNVGGNRGIASLLPPSGTMDSLTLSVFTLINIVDTNVSILPDWFDHHLRSTVNSATLQSQPILAASGTPLCDNTAKVISGALSSFPGLDGLPAEKRSFVMNFTHADAASLSSMSFCWPVPARYYPLAWEDDASHS